MLSKNQDERNVMEIVSIDTLVPSDHLLRKIDEAIDFEHIYDIVKDLYCEDNGRPSIDPVVLFKIVLIQHIYGIPSLRRTLEEINMNMAYRWFLGYSLTEAVPGNDIPIGVESRSRRRLFGSFGDLCGRNPYQSQCKYEKEGPKDSTQRSETIYSRII